MTWVTPSPESITVPVSDLSATLEEVQEAAKARTAWTAMYSPAQLNDSNIISAVFSRFSGGFRGCKNVSHAQKNFKHAYRFCQEEIMVFGLNSEIFEYRIRPEPLHMVPILHLTMSNRVVYTIAWTRSSDQSLISNEEVQVFGSPLPR
jgi:hypothetical protein